MLIKLGHKNKCPPVLNETQIHLDGATVRYVKSQLVELAISSITHLNYKHNFTIIGWLVLSKYLRLLHCICKPFPLFCYVIRLKKLGKDDFKLTLAVNCMSQEVNEASLYRLCCSGQPYCGSPSYTAQLAGLKWGLWRQACNPLSCSQLLSKVISC